MAIRIPDLNDGTPHTAALALGDLIEIVDVSDTTDHATGSSFPRSLATLSRCATPQTGTTYTILADDDNTMVEFTNAAQVTVTIPTDASDDLRDGYIVVLFAAGAGGVTLSVAGITLKGSSPNTTIAQNEVMILEKSTSANTWFVTGGTSA